MNLFRKRTGTVYLIRTERWGRWHWMPGAGRPETGYVGKTWRKPATRIMEHRTTQPWSDLIVDWQILWRGETTAFGLWWREIYYIVTRMPRYNYQWNRWNPRRQPVWLAQEERTQRQPGWRPKLRRSA